MPIDWSRAKIVKEKDHDGRNVERLIYPGETKQCKDCRFMKNDQYSKVYYRCLKLPKKSWRKLAVACALFECSIQEVK